jgi:uncharacterized protein (TIGR02058 family)
MLDDLPLLPAEDVIAINGLQNGEWVGGHGDQSNPERMSFHGIAKFFCGSSIGCAFVQVMRYLFYDVTGKPPDTIAWESWARLGTAFRASIRNESMARVRCITEMGMGVDVHGRDATKAAKRAVSDAIRHSSLGFVRMLGKTPHDMFVDVTIGVPDPGAVDTSAVAKELPYGTVTVKAVKGGLEIPAESGGDAITIANAAVIVSLDDSKPA